MPIGRIARSFNATLFLENDVGDRFGLAQHAVLLDVVSGMIFLVPREFAGKISKIWSSPHFGPPAKPQLFTYLIRKFPKLHNRELPHHIREFMTRIRVVKPGIRDFFILPLLRT